MNQNELETWIVEQLSRGVSQQEIITSISTHQGLYWTDAEALVRRVAEEKSQTIERKQAPLLTALAVILFVTGLVTVFLGLSVYLQLFIGEKALPLNAATLLMAFWQFGPEVILTVFSGAGMVVGSLVGMKRVWLSLLG